MNAYVLVQTFFEILNIVSSVLVSIDARGASAGYNQHAEETISARIKS